MGKRNVCNGKQFGLKDYDLCDGVNGVTSVVPRHSIWFGQSHNKILVAVCIAANLDFEIERR